MHHLTALEQLAWLRRGEVSPRELTEHYLARIERLDLELGAFATVTPDLARERADAVAGTAKAAALWGLPIADKDLVARAGVPTGHGPDATWPCPGEGAGSFRFEVGALSGGEAFGFASTPRKS